LQRDGPIQLIEREFKTLPYLKGKLRTTTWLRKAMWEPHRLPVTFDQLTPDNDFSRGLARVAELLARATVSPEVKSVLLKAVRELRPGHGEEVAVSKTIANRRLPSQWSIYEPAWSIAAAVLAERFLIGSAGQYQGLSVAVEAWPLLERLLARSLSATVHLAAKAGMRLTAPSKFRTTLLDRPGGSASKSHAVEPDGRLVVEGKTVATFEAKYKRRPENRDWPAREDIYQAITTAAACGARMAVLVYPEEFPTAWWRIRGFDGYPEHLAAVGLGLFSYRVGAGDDERGRKLLEIFNGAHWTEANSQSMDVEVEI
jgi:hypothetical protein